MSESRVFVIGSFTDGNAFVDDQGVLRADGVKRVFGTNFTGASLETNVWTPNLVGTGTVTLGLTGYAAITTGTTANSSANITSVNPARFLFGRSNVLRAKARLAGDGLPGNVRTICAYIDASNEFGFMLNGQIFGVYAKYAGTTTFIPAGQMNGNGAEETVGVGLNGNYEVFEILFHSQRVTFAINQKAIHTFYAGVLPVSRSMVAKVQVSSTNSNGQTANLGWHLLGAGMFQDGTASNVPVWKCLQTPDSTTVLKSVGGTLQSLSVTKSSTGNSVLSLYDGISSAGALIGSWDLAATASVGNHTFGTQGLNFYSGLTAVIVGAGTGFSTTLCWD